MIDIIQLTLKVSNLGGNAQVTREMVEVIIKVLDGNSLTDEEIDIFDNFLRQLPPAGSVIGNLP